MLKLKPDWTCSYCSKIFKDPIDLPCGDTVCRQHLSDKDVVKENKIKCIDCNQEFKMTCDEFRSNKRLKNLIESQSYLSQEEISLKKKLEESIQKFFQFYDELTQNKAKLPSQVFDHFQEIRFQIDEHREEVKKRIDEIALKMIDETKKNEEIYLNNLKENLSSLDDCKSLDTQLNEIEETFRNPNLLIGTIKEMQRKQEESLKDIQSKLNQMTKVHLKATNEFRPNLYLIDLERTCSFGLIKLNACWLNYNTLTLYMSEILTNQRQSLIELCEFSQKDKWSLLYRGTRDGFGAVEFHSRCDGHSNTLTILKAKQTSYIFGGFTTVSWESSGRWKSDPNAFIFSLTNRDNQPCKMKSDPARSQFSIYCDSDNGPSFGVDIHIADNANTTDESYSDLGDCYKHLQYAEGTNEAKTFLAGSFRFQLDEIEVFKKE